MGRFGIVVLCQYKPYRWADHSEIRCSQINHAVHSKHVEVSSGRENNALDFKPLYVEIELKGHRRLA